MKYKKCLLLLVIILIPVMVNSESNYYSYSTFTNYSCIGYNNYIYGTDVTYFDGKYHLVDSYSKCYGMEAAECNSHEAMYTCGNRGTTECEEISLLLTNSNCINTNSDRIVISLKNGIKYEDIKNFYVGKDYEKVNNKYKLLDYEVHNINEINSQEYLSKNFLNYYFCIDNYGISCDRLVRIYKVENNAYGVLWGII